MLLGISLLLAYGCLGAITAKPQPAASEPAKKLTLQEAKQRAILADQSINKVLPAEFSDFIGWEGYSFVFFGVQDCKYCIKATPRWLQLQTNIPTSPLKHTALKMGKVDCTNELQWCQAPGRADGYPTILLYGPGGKVLGEYGGEHQAKYMGEWVFSTIANAEASHDNRDL